MGALLSWLPGPFGQDRTLRVRRGQLLAAARIGWLGRSGEGARLQRRRWLQSALGRHPGHRLRTPARWSLTAEAELGWAVAEYRGGIISEFSELTSTFFLLATRRLSEGDESIFSLNSPRLEQGLAALSLPAVPRGTVLHQSVATELTPSGRLARSDG